MAVSVCWLCLSTHVAASHVPDRAGNLPDPSAQARAMSLRVMLVDDHAVVRAGYRRLLELESDFEVVAECADGDAALTLLQQRQGAGVDVMVLDLSMPGRSGLDLLRRVALRWPAVRQLVFGMHDSPVMVAQALQAGADGFVTKSSQPEWLVAVQPLKRRAAAPSAPSAPGGPARHAAAHSVRWAIPSRSTTWRSCS